MSFPLHDKNVIMQHLLPEDPEPNQIVSLPDGQTVGGANVINLYKNEVLLGSATQLAPIHNVSGKYTLTRATTRKPLTEKDIVRVVCRQYTFISVIFREYFGWAGFQTANNPIVITDKLFTVLSITGIGPNTKDFHLYERVCLSIINTEKTHETKDAPGIS